MTMAYDINHTVIPARGASTPASRALMLLQVTFSLLFIVAGLDKFTNLLVDWSQYVAPTLARFIPWSLSTEMRIGGTLEILLGVLVAVNPRVGGLMSAAWLWAIVANLLIGTGYYDIAARDAALSLGALALAQLASLPRIVTTRDAERTMVATAPRCQETWEPVPH